MDLRVIVMGLPPMLGQFGVVGGAPEVTEQIIWRASYAIYHQRSGG